MRLRHIFANASSRAFVEGDRAFFLRNQPGDMLSLFTKSQTRYAGWFFWNGNRFTKILEGLRVLDDAGNEQEVIAITNTGDQVVWEYADGLELSWQLSSETSAVQVALSRPARLRILLDIRDMYASPSFGRTYDAKLSGKSVVVRYSQEGAGTFPLLHMRCEGTMQLTGTWKEQQYPRDAARHSAPAQLYAYELGIATASQLSFGLGATPELAAAASLAVSVTLPSVPHVGINHSHDTLLTQIQTARVSVRQSLRWLETQKGLWAGLPWFHQVWTRDELITALGLQPQEQREIIRRYLGMPVIRGELATFQGSTTTCADGIGWLCLLVEEHGLDKLSSEEHTRLLHLLERSYLGLIRERQASHGLIKSEYNATWMDTIGREGYRLEIQSMFALQLSLLYRLSGEERYHQERLRFLSTLRQLLFREGYLWDGLGDSRKRPNVFLAYLIQPDLLSQQAWVSCFDAVLPALSTRWGGLASLDYHDPLFQPLTTGEDNRSYHNGDSWFFVNNLAALALHRLDNRRYGKTIVELLQSSTEEILWEHMIGQPGEISSAEHMDSFGCGIQAFSGGAYLMLVDELEGYSERQERDSIAAFWDATADSAAESRLS